MSDGREDERLERKYIYAHVGMTRADRERERERGRIEKYEVRLLPPFCLRRCMWHLLSSPLTIPQIGNSIVNIALGERRMQGGRGYIPLRCHNNCIYICSKVLIENRGTWECLIPRGSQYIRQALHSIVIDMNAREGT